MEYDRATQSPVDRRLSELIEAGGPLAITEPVVMEVLAGARDDRREADLRRLLHRFEMLVVDSLADFDGDMRIYRRCRAAGATPRGMLDSMSASVAWRRGAALLRSRRRPRSRVQRDRDRERRRVPAGRQLTGQAGSRRRPTHRSAFGRVVQACPPS